MDYQEDSGAGYQVIAKKHLAMLFFARFRILLILDCNVDY